MNRVFTLLFFAVFLCMFTAGYSAEMDDNSIKSGKDNNAVSSAAKEYKGEKRKPVITKLGSILVQGKQDYLLFSEVACPVDVITTQSIESESTGYSMELLKKAPGIYYGHWNQGAVTGTATLRGFDFDHDSPIKLIIDGVPHNRAGGPMDAHLLFPMEIERMELVKGTSDVRYGLNNLSGTLSLFTHQGGNRTKVRLLYGSYNTIDAGTLVSMEAKGFAQTYFVGYQQSDGYRDHSSYKKGAASGKWFYTTRDGRLKTGLILRVFGMDGDSPGYLNAEDAEKNPTESYSYNQTDGSRQVNHNASFHMQYSLSDSLFFSFAGYARRFDRTRWARFDETWGQSERMRDESDYGGIANLVYEEHFSGFLLNSVKLSCGADYELQDNAYMRYNTVDRVRQSLHSGWEYTSHNEGGFFQADATVMKIVRILAGTRADRFNGEFTSKKTENRTDMVDFGIIWQPKIGAIITPITGYSLYANWGRTFQLPSENERFAQTSKGGDITGDISYSRNDGWEIGTRISPAAKITMRFTYWQMVRSNELKPNIDGTYDAVGKTERKGWEAALNITPVGWLNLWGSYAGQQAEYTEPGPTYQSIKGNDIPIIPDYNAKYGIDIELPFSFTLSMWGEMQGEYYADADNSVTVDAFHLMNGALRYKIDNRMMFNLNVHNIFDERYIAFAWDTFKYGKTDAYSPGNGRNISFFVTVTLL